MVLPQDESGPAASEGPDFTDSQRGIQKQTKTEEFANQVFIYLDLNFYWKVRTEERQ